MGVSAGKRRDDIKITAIAVSLDTKIAQAHGILQIACFDILQILAIRGDTFGDKHAAARAGITPAG